MPPTSPAPSLLRGLDRFDVVAITFNNIVGAGVFTMPAALAAGAGRWSLAVFLATLALVVLMALCTAEVASRYDVTGGPLYYAVVAFGRPVGFVVGWLMYLSRLAGFGAIAVIGLDYSAGVWPAMASPAARTTATTIFIAALVAINLRGVVSGALASNVLAIVKTAPLVLLAIGGMWVGRWVSGPPTPIPRFDQVGGALLIAFFACMGFEQAAIVAGEVRRPRRDLPAGILGGVLGVGLLYALLMLTCFETVPDLAHARRPLADAAAALVGPSGGTVISLTAVLSCAGALCVWMMVSPRVLYALAALGDFPAAFAKVDSLRRTPAVAIIASALVVWLLTTSGAFVYLATFSAMARMLMYASTCAALITLRRRDGPAPLTVPLGPLWAVLALVATIAAIGTTPGAAVRDLAVAVAIGWAARTLSRRLARV